jgi:uncharacterized protein HemY
MNNVGTLSLAQSEQKTNPSPWSRLFRYGLPSLIVLVMLSVTLYLYREWARFHTQSYFVQCQLARDDANWHELKRLAERWTAWDRRSADGWLFRADAAQHLGDFTSAARYLASVPESDPKALPALVSLATLQFNSLKRPFEGVKTCERMLQWEPRTTAAHELLIEFYALTLQRRHLLHQIRFAIRSNREPPSAYVYLVLIDTMRVENGIESNTRWLEEYPDSELFSVARVLQMAEPDGSVVAGADDDKFSLVEALFARFPRNLELLAYNVDLCIRKGTVDKLLDLLRNLPSEADEDPRFWRAKGWLHITRDEIPKAKQALQTAIDLDPLDWKARNWMADALRREGDLDGADSLQAIVRHSRDIRLRITSSTKEASTSVEILAEIAKFAADCGDVEVADALKRRIGPH